MRIALFSYAFYPAIGGLESVSLVLATEFARQGHEVRVITQTPAAAGDRTDFPFEMVRLPSRTQLWQTIAWCEIYFQNNISLPALWPVFLLHKPWVVTHQTWLRAVNGSLDRAARWKLRVTSWATVSVSISESIARQFTTPQTVIGNPYDSVLFRECPGVPRDRDLVFVGRLVSDKGVDLLLEALALLQKKNLDPSLTVIGGGPEEAALREQTTRLGLERKVTFAGPKRGGELTRLLNAHRIMVVPSRWAEPYGIVALEGLACGCVVVGSAEGGLTDAIGGCGLTFPNGDAAALAAALARILTEPGLTEKLRAGVGEHLLRQSPRQVANAYLAIFQRLVARK